MTHPASSPDPTGPPSEGPAPYNMTELYDADDSDAVVARILSSLRAGERAAATPTRFAVDATASCGSLPRRVPGANVIYGDSREGEPLVIRRNAASIAKNTSGYFRGWQRGHESIQTGGMVPAPARAAAAAVPAGPAPARRVTFRRRRPIPRTAVRLVGLVVRLLPAFERSRYGEEFRAEMRGLTGWQQLGYAIRLTLSAPALRRSLRREPAGGAPARERPRC